MEPLPFEKDLLAEIKSLQPIECGEEAAKHFAFDKNYTNLNHGSYGTYPISVRNLHRKYQDLTEARPDEFTRYRFRTHLLDHSRQTLATYLNVPVNTCVFSPNATLAFDTVLNNLDFKQGDVAIYFSSIYPSFLSTLVWLSETSSLELLKIGYDLPISDEELCKLFAEGIAAIEQSGRRARIAVFDTVNSLPAVRMPFERLTKICEEHNILSLIDAAHGIGLLPLSLNALRPSFLVSNLHKWLHVPRSCAILYVPDPKNRSLLRATLPTGFGFFPKDTTEEEVEIGWARNFSSLGTLDENAYLCVEGALEWREKMTWGQERGEEAVRGYVLDLARKGGEIVRSVLGTEVLGGGRGMLGDCGMVNVRLPLEKVVELTSRKEEVTEWLMRKMIVGEGIAVNVFFYLNAWWVRLSAQVYLTLEDFRKAGEALKKSCAEVEEWVRGDMVQE